MLDATTLIAFAFASFILAIVPGPNVTVIIATALQRGVVAGLAVVAGTSIGILSMVFVVALGFEALLGFMGWAFDWIKMLGAVYLIYLGYSMLRSNAKLDKDITVSREPLFKLAARGFLVLWSNPKMLLFFGAFIPQFVASGEPTFTSLILLGLIFFAVATFTDTLYALMAGSLGATLSNTRLKVLNKVSGLIVMAGGVWLAVQQKTGN